MANAGSVIIRIDGDDSRYKKVLTGLGKATQAAVKGLTITAGVLSAAWSAVGLTSVKYNAEIEQLETSFKTMTGSAQKAANVMERLRKLGAKTPFATKDLAEATQLLMQYGFDADIAIDRMEMLGDIAQGSSEKMMRIAAAYGQMNSAGKVQLEDVKQMLESGFNPLLEISEKTGESMESLYDRISRGTLAVQEITDAMRSATSEGGKFFNSMAAQSETVEGLLSTLKDELRTLGGDMFKPVSESLRTQLLPEAIRLVQEMQKAYGRGGIDGLIDSVTDEIPRLMDAASAALEKVAGKLKDKLPGILKKIISALPKLLASAGDSIIPTIVDTIFDVIAVAVEEIVGRLPELVPVLLRGFGNLLKSVFSGIWDVTTGLSNGIETALKRMGVIGMTPIEAFEEAWEKTDTSQYKDFELDLGVELTVEDYQSKVDTALETIRTELANIPGLTDDQRKEIENAIIGGAGIDVIEKTLNDLGVDQTIIDKILAEYNTVAGSLTAGVKSVFQTIADEFTNGIPETDAEIKEAIETVNALFDDAREDVEAWKANAIAELEASGLTGEALATAIADIESKAQGMIDELNDLEEQSIAWTQENANKSTEFVKGNLNQLDDIVAQVEDVSARIDLLTNEQFITAKARRGLVKAGAVSDVKGQLEAFAVTAQEMEKTIEDAESRAGDALNEAVEQFKNDADGYAAKEKEIFDRLAREKEAAWALYNAETAAIIAGIVKASPELSQAFEDFNAEQEAVGMAEKLRTAVADAINEAKVNGKPIDMTEFWESIKLEGVDMSALADAMGVDPLDLIEQVVNTFKTGMQDDSLNAALLEYTKGVESDFSEALKKAGIDESAYPAIKTAVEEGYLQVAGDVDWTNTETILSTGLQSAMGDAADSVDASAEGKPVGNELGNGVIAGIKEKKNAVVVAAQQMIRAAISGMKKEAEIASPSRATKRLGGFFGKGFALGIQDEIANARGAAQQMASSALAAVDSIGGRITVSRQAGAGNMASAFQAMLSGMNLATDSGTPIQLYINGRLVAETIKKDIAATQTAYNTSFARGVGK